MGSEYDVNNTRTRVRAERELVGAVGRRPVVGRFAVCDPGIGRHEHTSAGQARAPAQIEVLGAGERIGIEARQLGEEVDAHEHGGGRDVEHIAHAVVLLLVELTRIDAGVGRTEPVDGAPDVEEHLGVVGAHELRAHDAGVRAVRLLDEHTHRGRVEHDVVVAEQQERRVLRDRERLVGRGREPRAGVEPPHEGARELGGHPCRGILVGPAVDDQEREVGVVLVDEAGEGVLEPWPGIAGDHDRGDRRVGGGWLLDRVRIRPRRRRAGLGRGGHQGRQRTAATPPSRGARPVPCGP